MFTLADATNQRHQQDAAMEARWAARAAQASKALSRTTAGRAVLEARALRWLPPQYKGGATEWRNNNAEVLL